MAWRKKAYNVETLRQLAKAELPRPIFDFADGGAEDERTLRRNENAFDDYWLVPKPMNGAADRDLSVEFLGHRYSIPLVIGPTGLSGLLSGRLDFPACFGRMENARRRARQLQPVPDFA